MAEGTGDRVKAFIFWYLRQPFVTIVWFMETFARNRARVKDLMGRPMVRQAFTWMLVVTGAAWLAIALLAGDRHGERFDCALRTLVDNDVQNIECSNTAPE